jgi:hypothetical protein|tara:strand:+ start:2551 stop:2796 length:246 start_codon:yes stop_codon:yes gene_type:complete
MSEFKVGDLVTFKAYEKAIPAKVKKVLPQQKHLNGELDDRQFYLLHGTGQKLSESLISQCTGMAIIESKYYEEYNPINKWD